MIIHRADCANVTASLEPERVVSISWEGGQQRHTVHLELRAQRAPLVLNELMQFLVGLGIELSGTRTRNAGEDELSILLSIELRSAEQLSQTLANIARHPRILSVRRLSQGS